MEFVSRKSDNSLISIGRYQCDRVNGEVAFDLTELKSAILQLYTPLNTRFRHYYHAQSYAIVCTVNFVTSVIWGVFAMAKHLGISLFKAVYC